MFEKVVDLYGFYRFFQKWDFAESQGFLRSNQCIKMLHLSYQTTLQDIFHILLYNGGVCFFRPPVGGSNGILIKKEKNRVVCYDKRHLKNIQARQILD